MSDYSNIKVEKVDWVDFDTLPYTAGGNRQKALGPSSLFGTLPFLKEMEVGEVVKFPIPDDAFGYQKVREVENGDKYAALRAALHRNFKILAEKTDYSFTFRISEDEMYIKRLAS